MRTAREKAAKRRAPPLPRRGKGAFMSVEELWREHMPEKGRNQVYALATSGIFPFNRHGRRIDLWRKPTLEIIAGKRPPGGLLPVQPDRATPQSTAKKSAKRKSVARKSEAAPAVAAP